jgi:hypothetical protein
VPPASAPVLVITDAFFQRILERLPRFLGPGLSGWSYDHTYDHIRASTGTSPTDTSAVLELLNLLFRGHLPNLPSLSASALIALKKPGGRGVRPIAVGEVWLRLASLCAMAACPDTGPALAHLQLGVGVPGGSQCVGHVLRLSLSCCPEEMTLLLDFQNAFNSASRQALLQAVACRGPRLLPFAAWTYRTHRLLVVRGAPRRATPSLLPEGGSPG